MSEPLHSHDPDHAPHGHSNTDHDHNDHQDDHAYDHSGRPGHSHASITPLSDPALATKAGIFAVKVSLVVLFVTALFQLGVALRSGSVALLADTIHNFADALTAIPL